MKNLCISHAVAICILTLVDFLTTKTNLVGNFLVLICPNITILEIYDQYFRVELAILILYWPKNVMCMQLGILALYKCSYKTLTTTCSV